MRRIQFEIRDTMRSLSRHESRLAEGGFQAVNWRNSLELFRMRILGMIAAMTEPASDEETPDNQNTGMETGTKRLEEARRALLDLGKSNRLISFKSRTRLAMPIVDEKPVEVFNTLVAEGKRMRFAPSQGALAEEDERDPSRYTDRYLQTSLGADALKNKLLFLSREAANALDEQGAHLLFLALGFLEWRENGASGSRLSAPLVMVPVELRRKNVRSGFQILHSGDDAESNICLETKLQEDFGLEFPLDSRLETREDIEAYFKNLQDQIQDLPGWRVLDDIALGLFTYSKFLMYRDLEPSLWSGQWNESPIRPLRTILSGTPAAAPEGPDEESENSEPIDSFQVMDADASQREAIELAKHGRNLVIQGPPGTGKSQTITNLIAELLGQGKRVLFVSEKMAALNVVNDRLHRVGLGDFCLELHSRNANKRAFLDSLEQALISPRPAKPKGENDIRNYRESLEALDGYGQELLRAIGQTTHSVYDLVTESTGASALANHAKPRLDEPETWSADTYREIESAVRDLADTLKRIGRPNAHALRAIETTELTAAAQSRASERLSSVLETYQQATSQAETLQSEFPSLRLETNRSLNQIPNLAHLLTEAPHAVQEHIAEIDFNVSIENAQDALKALARYQPLQRRLRAEFHRERIPFASVESIHETLRSHQGNRLRIFNGAYRRAKKTLTDWMQASKTLPYPRLLERAEFLTQLRAAEERYLQYEAAGRKSFGPLWAGPETRHAQAEQWLRWLSDATDVLSSQLIEPASLKELITRSVDPEAAQRMGRFAEILQELENSLTNLHEALACPSLLWDAIQEWSPDASIERLRQMRETFDTIWDWVAFRRAERAVAEGQASCLLSSIWAGELNEDTLEPALRYAYAEQLLEFEFEQREALRNFDRERFDRAIDLFKKSDRKLIHHARQRLAHMLGAQAPRILEGLSGEGSELGILQREFLKKRRIKPIRRLLEEAGSMIQRAKPVFLMSPLSIAQFLPPNRIDFDIVIFDEASQVKPEDALGAIARGKQLIVVGDSQQLPPTRFFSRLEADEDLDPESDDRLSDLESILDVATASGMSTRWLTWHYRSRHDSLIATSNREFYGDRLTLFPSPRGRDQRFGLSFRKAEDAYYESGGSGVNPNEARAVAEAVMRHAKEDSGRSLGVGAFSMRQQNEILDTLEELRRAEPDPEVESFFDPDRDEPFFVKNLENIQGDERDVIYLSICYAKTAPDRPMAMRLGPLNQEGGERRLNVLISRAREQCVVFSSIDPEDLDLNRTDAEGPKALRSFLEYARDGEKRDLNHNEDAVTDLGRLISQALARRGYATVPAVGTGRMALDLAAKDPERPDRFAVGIELDGSVYRSAANARERDRLRSEILEGLGWNLHRVWTVDWRRDAEAELKRVIDAIERASKRRGDTTRPRAADTMTLKRESEAESLQLDNLSVRYAIYNQPASKPGKKLIKDIIRLENPIHEDDVIERAKEALDQSRLTKTFVEEQHEHLMAALRDGAIEYLQDDERFLVAKGWEPIYTQPRRRSWKGINPDRIATIEILAAADRLIDVTGEINLDDCIKNISLLLGLKTLTPRAQDRFHEVLIRKNLDRIGLNLDHRNRVSRAEGADRLFRV